MRVFFFTFFLLIILSFLFFLGFVCVSFYGCLLVLYLQFVIIKRVTLSTTRTGSVLGVKRPGCGADYPPLSSAEVERGFKIYPHLPSVPAQACHGVPFAFIFIYQSMLNNLRPHSCGGKNHISFVIVDGAFKMVDSAVFVESTNLNARIVIRNIRDRLAGHFVRDIWHLSHSYTF